MGRQVPLADLRTGLFGSPGRGDPQPGAPPGWGAAHPSPYSVTVSRLAGRLAPLPLLTGRVRLTALALTGVLIQDDRRPRSPRTFPGPTPPGG
jgi:hypothetical protein